MININEVDKNGDTCLHLALLRDGGIDRVSIIRVLLNHPLIMVDIRNKNGESPLDIAKEDMPQHSSNDRLEHCHSSMIITLLQDFVIERRRMAYRYFIAKMIGRNR
jgi:hypothetical protein